MGAGGIAGPIPALVQTGSNVLTGTSAGNIIGGGPGTNEPSKGSGLGHLFQSSSGSSLSDRDDIVSNVLSDSTSGSGQLASALTGDSRSSQASGPSSLGQLPGFLNNAFGGSGSSSNLSPSSKDGFVSDQLRPESQLQGSADSLSGLANGLSGLPLPAFGGDALPGLSGLDSAGYGTGSGGIPLLGPNSGLPVVNGLTNAVTGVSPTGEFVISPCI